MYNHFLKVQTQKIILYLSTGLTDENDFEFRFQQWFWTCLRSKKMNLCSNHSLFVKKEQYIYSKDRVVIKNRHRQDE